MSDENSLSDSASVSKDSDKQKSSSITKNLQKAFSKLKKSKTSSRTAVKVIAKILVSGGWILLVIILLIGIIMFFLTMPGMVMEKIKGLFRAIGDTWSAWWGEDNAKQFKQCEVYKIADYLDDMGYDLKGYGFVTEFLTDPDKQYDRGDAEEEAKGLKSTTDGVIRDENNDVVTAKSEFINTYLISENYIYTIKNFNVNTETGWTAFWNHVEALFSTTSALKHRSGMLVFYHDTGKVGERDGAYKASERGYIKFDPDSRKLLIKKGWTNSAMSYSLDGWTGRYGMPVDFLLTVHLATQMPDLAYDMATHFHTEVNILLNSSKGTVYGAYKLGGDSYVTYDKIMKAFNEIESTGWLADIINKIDNSKITAEEITNVHNLGIYPPGGCDCTKSEEGKTTYKTSNGTYPVSKDEKGYYYTIFNQANPRGKKEYISEEEVDFGGGISSVGSNCKQYIKFIANRMMKGSDDSYQTYTPYIESVQNHWFRDVYFVEKSVNDKKEKIAGFVDYDYQYELITGERWTLYETYTSDPNDGDLYKPEKEGEFVYYLVNDDGTIGDRYEGTVTSEKNLVEKKKPDNTVDGTTIERQASRGEKGEAVVKKAKTIDLSERFNDLGWKVSEWGNYIAYDPKDTESEANYDPMYSDSEIAGGENDLEKDAMSHMYIEVAISTINQTGEGLRTETNPDIKKMFLVNNYFKYDGSRQKAEIIYALREAANLGYGPILKSKIQKSDGTYVEYDLKFDDKKYTTKPENKKYKLKDYVGNVSIQQDALNTFASLENIHTEDSDYIYKDFKELVVELGYFEKEELTEAKPKILQWIVPDIGSGGYPDRSIDKREEEFGTLVHSKLDMDVNKEQTLVALYEKIAKMEKQEQIEGNAPNTPNIEPASGISGNNDSQKLSQVSGLQKNSDVGNGDILSSNNSKTNFKNVKGTKPSFVLERVDEAGDGYKSVVTSGNVKYIHRYQGGQSYSGIHFFWAGGDRTLGKAACGLFACFNVLTGYGYPFDPRVDLPGYRWPATMDAVKKLMEEKGVTGQFVNYTDTAAMDQALNEGRPIILLFQSTVDKQGVRWTTGGHFVAFVGKDSAGNILSVDSAAGGDVKRHDYPGTLDDMLPAFQTNQVWIADEPPKGGKKDGAPYEGYLGNEAVVSPVTGVLMEYGTYTEEEAEENRENIDLKYGGLLEKYTFEEEIVKDPVTGEETKKIKYPSDKVGYAVIKILDAETYEKLEKTVENKWKEKSLVKVNEKSKDYDEINKHVSFKEETEELLDDKRSEKWNKVDETVYGYKEFAEQYERFGIGGHYVYIDGFKCETVDEELASKEKSDKPEDKKVIPKGEELKLESFKITEKDILNEDFEPDTTSLYESDDVSKLISEYETKKLKAEAGIKADASLGITFSFDDIVVDEEGNGTGKKEKNEYIVIKEGTVLGRTLTDYELLEGEDFRNGKYGTYDEYIKAHEDRIEKEKEKEKAKKDKKNPKPGEIDEELKIEKIPLVGNYLRIIMQEKDGDIVENVEDYMKLDEQKAKEKCEFEHLAYFLGCLEESFSEKMDLGSSYGVEVLKDGAGNTTAFGLTRAVAETVQSEWPSFASDLAAGSVPKDEAQDVFILVLEAAKESIQKKLTTPLEEDDSSLFALIDLSHASPSECDKVINVYNSKNNNLSKEEMMDVFTEHWGSNENYGVLLRRRGRNRGWLASEGRWFLYQEGSEGDEVFFDSETPWTEFCEAGGTSAMTQESSGLYHVEKGVDKDYINE